MDLKTGLIILGEFALLGACVWGLAHEKALIRAEKRAARNTGRLIKKFCLRYETRRRAGIEKRALYTPVKPPQRNTETRAA